MSTGPDKSPDVCQMCAQSALTKDRPGGTELLLAK